MPERVDRLHRRGKNVLHEFACLPGQMLALHDLIVSKVKLVPAFPHLYNQGNITCIEIERLGQEPMAL